MKKPNVVLLPKKSYLSHIANSVQSGAYHHFFALVDDAETEIIKDGDKACALFVSSALAAFGLLPHCDVTVHRVLRLMLENGWEKTTELKKGCIIVWEEVVNGKGTSRKHIGFYMGNSVAVSNSSKDRCPTMHPHVRYAERGIESLWWHPALESDASLLEYMEKL